MDNLFPFIEPIMEPAEEDLSYFIAQMDAFLDSEQHEGRRLAIARPLSEETYKQMWMLRYQQHMGQMTFLELLDQYEEILGIPPRSASEQ